MKSRALVCMAAGAVLAISSVAYAQTGKSTTNQGSAPNGKPFQAIQQDLTGLQTQIDDLNAQTAALRAQVAALDASLAAVTTGLQSQLNDIYSQVSNLEGRVTTVEGQVTALNGQMSSLSGQVAGLASRIQSVEDAVALLSGRVDANTAAIAALDAANATLGAMLADVQSQLAAATGFLLGELSRVAGELQTQISTNGSNITALQNQTAQMQAFLNNLSLYDCSAGQAVQGIGPTGVILCTTAGGGNLSSYTVEGWFYLYGGSSGSANYSCPAGYTTMNGGYSHWPSSDYQVVSVSDTYTTPYISYWNQTYSYVQGGSGYVYWYYPTLSYNYNYTTQQMYIPFRSSQITEDRVRFNVYYISAQSQYGYYNPTNYVNWSVTCARVQ